MNTQIQFKSIPDVRRHMISILDAEVDNDINMIIDARKRDIPVSYIDIYEEINRFQNLIEYHKLQIKKEENVTN